MARLDWLVLANDGTNITAVNEETGATWGPDTIASYESMLAAETQGIVDSNAPPLKVHICRERVYAGTGETA